MLVVLEHALMLDGLRQRPRAEVPIAIILRLGLVILERTDICAMRQHRISNLRPEKIDTAIHDTTPMKTGVVRCRLRAQKGTSSRGGIRTREPLRATDFKSVAFTSFATRLRRSQNRRHRRQKSNGGGTL